jgi:hypothetical protein
MVLSIKSQFLAKTGVFWLFASKFVLTTVILDQALKFDS